MLWRPVMSALLAATAPSRVVIVPGKGCSGEVRDANWYGWLEQQLVADGAFEEVVLRNMPDPVVARESVWVPFLREECECDARTIVVGHSSGAEAAMLAELSAMRAAVSGAYSSLFATGTSQDPVRLHNQADPPPP